MSAVVGIPVNGTAFPPAANFDRLLEYEKILKLHDEIFAGSHPRLTVPAHAIKQVKRVSPSPHQSQQPPSNAVHSNPTAVDFPGLRLTANPATNKPRPSKVNGLPTPTPAPVSKQHPAVSMPSGIDPVLLTKSDDLIRAETQLARQRLEKSLKEQFEHKRIEARRRPAPGEAKPDVDLSAALSRALEAVGPGLTTPPSSPDDGASAGDSFDENSFYSSKAPDSTPDNVTHAKLSPADSRPAMVAEADAFDIRSLQRRGLLPEGDVLESSYETNARSSRAAAQDRSRKLPWQLRSQKMPDSADLIALEDDDEDEGEYSPPEPEEQIPLTEQPGQAGYDGQAAPRRPLRRYSELDDNTKGYGRQPDADMRIVRNQITSPVAPQPSRVSPLAVAKAPLIVQKPLNRKERKRLQNGRTGNRSSPEVLAQTPQQHGCQPNKRRKLDRSKKSNRHGADASSDTHVKNEPVSPPPFHDKQPLGVRMRGAVNRPIYVEDAPRHETGYQPSSERYVIGSPRQSTYEVDHSMPRSEPRPFSRSGHRLLRDEQDLRKVASLQNLRSEQPREYMQPVYETPRTRATSLAFQEPMPAYGREPLRERVVLSPAPTYRDFDQPQHYQQRPAMMPTPKRRIVTDEFGNEYEMIPRASVAPRAVPMELDVYEDSVYSRNRTSPTYAEPPPERRYMQEMAPPPQVSYRRIAESPRLPVTDARATWREQPLESASSRRSGSVFVDYPPRQVIYADDPAEARGMRMASVRPAPPIYEDFQPRETAQRVQSVRPAAREANVYMTDKPEMRREYIPVPSPTYRVLSQDGRYYEMRS